jgi:transposase-like protein
MCATDQLGFNFGTVGMFLSVKYYCRFTLRYTKFSVYLNYRFVIVDYSLGSKLKHTNSSKTNLGLL